MHSAAEKSSISSSRIAVSKRTSSAKQAKKLEVGLNVWCKNNPRTVDANITGQLSVAAACHERGLHCILLGTGALYLADGKRNYAVLWGFPYEKKHDG